MATVGQYQQTAMQYLKRIQTLEIVTIIANNPHIYHAVRDNEGMRASGPHDILGLSMEDRWPLIL